MTIKDKTLTEKQRLAINDLIYLGLCEIRYLCFDGQAKRAGLLADGFHNIIKMAATAQGSMSEIKAELAYYYDEYGDSHDKGRFDFLKFIKSCST